MSEMVERVAAAMNAHLGRHAEAGFGMAEMTDIARAAIVAMREPTQEILDACADAVPMGEGTPKWLWQVMIDAALAEETKPGA